MHLAVVKRLPRGWDLQQLFWTRGVRKLLCAFEKTDYCAVDVDFNLAGRMTGLGCWSAQRRRRARRQEQLRTYPFFYQHGALVVRQAERLSKIARRAPLIRRRSGSATRPS